MSRKYSWSKSMQILIRHALWWRAYLKDHVDRNYPSLLSISSRRVNQTHMRRFKSRLFACRTHFLFGTSPYEQGTPVVLELTGSELYSELYSLLFIPLICEFWKTTAAFNQWEMLYTFLCHCHLRDFSRELRMTSNLSASKEKPPLTSSLRLKILKRQAC